MYKSSIPKVIHYFWFGGSPLPPLAEKCIESWKKYLPDYEIKEWNESNFDVNAIQYTRQAYEAGKYAFVSDYARLWVLYKYGGVYLDTDVEVIKSFDDILEKGAFMGLEPQEDGGFAVASGLGMACSSSLSVYREMIESYEKDCFIAKDGRQNLLTIVRRITDILSRHGLTNKNEIQEVEGITIYPTDYFCPKDFASGRLTTTENTHSIHWYDASWQPISSKIFYSFTRHLPVSCRGYLKKILRKMKGL